MIFLDLLSWIGKGMDDFKGFHLDLPALKATIPQTRKPFEEFL
jgi:hypothetical protein